MNKILVTVWDRFMVGMVLIHLLGALLLPFFPQWIEPQVWSGMCHQIPERSFGWGGIAMPICGRCTGIFLGFLIGRFWFGYDRLSKKLIFISLVLMVLMSLEWKLSHDALIASNNVVRLITGTLFGVGYSYVFHSLPLLLISKVQWVRALKVSLIR